MLTLKKDGPTDLMALLEDNFRNGRPLLEDAVLYRGTRLPDQTQGSYSKDTMHGSLLPQVAAGYTHNWDEKTAFIGTYKVDREKTRFFADFGLEQELNGKAVRSYSVQDAEKALQPLVKELVSAGSDRERRGVEARIEKLVKSDFYEAGVPTRTHSGEPNRPDTLYAYRGRPDVALRQAVTVQLQRIGPHNERVAKDVVYAQHRNEVGQALHTLGAQPTPAAKAVRTIAAVAQASYGNELRHAHDAKPLNEFLNAVAKEPVSGMQSRMGQFAKLIVESAGHPDKAIQAKALDVAERIGKLDPSKSDFNDLLRASSSAKSSSVGSSMSQGSSSSMRQAAPALDR